MKKKREDSEDEAHGAATRETGLHGGNYNRRRTKLWSEMHVVLQAHMSVFKPMCLFSLQRVFSSTTQRSLLRQAGRQA